MSNLDSILTEIVVNSFTDTRLIEVLVEGQGTDWILEKLKRLIDEGHQFSENPAVTEYLRNRYSVLKGYIQERNRLMHSYWISLRKSEDLVESVHFRRSGSFARMQSVEQIERFAESLEREYRILEIICDTDCNAPDFVKMFNNLLKEIAQQENRPNSAD